jgi:hypothetical protein
VVNIAAAAMVIKSTKIQRPTVPRELRSALPAGPATHSDEEDTVADTRCQNSEVAICFPRTSNDQDIREEWAFNSQRKSTNERRLCVTVNLALTLIDVQLRSGVDSQLAEFLSLKSSEPGSTLSRHEFHFALLAAIAS